MGGYIQVQISKSIPNKKAWFFKVRVCLRQHPAGIFLRFNGHPGITASRAANTTSVPVPAILPTYFSSQNSL